MRSLEKTPQLGGLTMCWVIANPGGRGLLMNGERGVTSPGVVSIPTKYSAISGGTFSRAQDIFSTFLLTESNAFVMSHIARMHKQGESLRVWVFYEVLKLKYCCFSASSSSRSMLAELQKACYNSPIFVWYLIQSFWTIVSAVYRVA